MYQARLLFHRQITNLLSPLAVGVTYVMMSTCLLPSMSQQPITFSSCLDSKTPAGPGTIPFCLGRAAAHRCSITKRATAVTLPPMLPTQYKHYSIDHHCPHPRTNSLQSHWVHSSIISPTIICINFSSPLQFCLLQFIPLAPLTAVLVPHDLQVISGVFLSTTSTCPQSSHLTMSLFLRCSWVASWRVSLGQRTMRVSVGCCIAYNNMEQLRKVRQQKIDKLTAFHQIYPADQYALKLAVRTCGSRCLSSDKQGELQKQQRRCFSQCLWKLGQVMSGDY